MRFEQLLRRVTYLVVFGVVIATPFEIDIVPAGPGPLPETITVEVSSGYLSMFDENGLDPQPDPATSDGTVETGIYQLDDVMRLHIDFDARLQPNIHSGMTGTVRIAGPGIAPAEVEFRTWVFREGQAAPMELVIRATVIYWFLWLVIRGTGKRSLSEISPLELLIIVVLGDFVQQGFTQEDNSVTGAIIVISTFVGWMIIGDLVARRSKGAERILEGQAIIVLRDGAPVHARLQTERLTLDDLLSAAREDGYGHLDEISLGVLEADGKFSFLPRRNEESLGAPDHTGG